MGSLPAADSGNISLSRWLAVPVRESGMADSPDFISPVRSKIKGKQVVHMSV